METVNLECFDQKLQTDRHGMGAERMDVCRQDSCTLEMDASTRCVEVWVSPIDQLTDWHSASPATKGAAWTPHEERLSCNPAVAEETSLGHVRWAEKMAHMLLFAFAWRSCTTKRWREWKLKPLVLHKRQDTAPILVTDVLGSVFDQLMTVQSA